MKSFILAVPLAMLIASAAHAQPAPYNCQNDPVRIDIRAQALLTALDALSRQTNCPISRDVDVTKLRGNAVRGRMSPANAIVALVRGTGLEAHPVRQGLAIDRSGQQEIAARADALDRRIRVRQTAGHLTPGRANALSRQVAQVRRQAVLFARQQGFVSAAEKASFQRTFKEIDAALKA